MIHIRAQALASILWPALCKARFFKDTSIDVTFTTSVREAAEKYKFDHPSPSWLHRVLLSLLVQAQPSTSLTCTPSGKCKPESLIVPDCISSRCLLHRQAAWSPPTISCFCWNELPSSSWTKRHVIELQFQSLYYSFHGYSLKVSPPPGYYVPSRYIFHRTECPRLSRCIEGIHPLKIDHRSEYCSFTPAPCHR